MTNSSKPGLLARLFGRANRAPVVTQLYSAVIGQPLLVHPAIGEQLVGAYLSGAIEARPPTLQIGEIAPPSTDSMGVATAGRSVAVINISGGLVNRFEAGYCEAPPLSYEELRVAYDKAQAGEAESIVLRMESPGGMGAGLFDFSDYIEANRGKKPVYAMVDDYAYSACYAIAAACDEIWLTRTGGVGSVGVIAYHYDQSAYDAKLGVKVTAIHSGEHKNDMTPHAPLAPSAAAWLQERMDSMRTMFAESVARYRGMSVDAVMATEAQVYQGAQGVAIGFADRVGTYADLLQHIRAGGKPANWSKPKAKGTEASASAGEIPQELTEKPPLLTEAQAIQLARGAIADRIHAAKLPAQLAMALIAPEAAVTPETVDARILHAKACDDLCAAAGIRSVAGDYAAKHTPIETVRSQLIAAKAEDGPEISTSIPTKPAAAGNQPLRAAAIYEERRKATEQAK